jgi:alkylation response protein AidB-like acyl-CoA dehydrogenase
MDLPFPLQLVYAEEMGRARVPSIPGTGVPIAGPTIVMHGTQAQKSRWLRPMLRADEIWAQGFSEPDAGSDLPSLRTRGERDGDEYVVTGQKLWSTHAHHADVIFTLVRTGTPDSGPGGISYLLIDAHAPGVTVRPIRDITGGTTFSEIVFDGVRVPMANRIGEENGGWAIARTSLGHERAAQGLTQAGFYRRVVADLIEVARQRGLTADPLVRQRLAWAETSVRLHLFGAQQAVAQILATGEPGPRSSVARLFFSEFEKGLHELAVDLLGPEAMLTGSKWVWGFLRTRASTIGAGTAEIQRNTIAERVLGLPREADPAG